MIGKYIEASPDSEARAEEAFRRALALNPRLSVAHKFYANLEADIGQAERALVRLLGEAARHGNDPELFAGLVHACRYCGLFDQSIAAHAEARRLDPERADQPRSDAADGRRHRPAPRRRGPAPDRRRRRWHPVIGLGLAGRRDEARAKLMRCASLSRIPFFQPWIEYLTAWLERRTADMAIRLSSVGPLEDPRGSRGDLPGRMAALRRRPVR